MKHITKFLGFIFFIIFLSCSEKRQVDSEYGNISGQLRTVLTEIGSEKQLFSILASQPNTIVGKEGTIILIPKESIVDQNSNLFTDTVIIELKEHFKLNDYLLSNLQTKHNDSLLVTEGMIFIRATDLKGHELKIAKGKKIRL